MKRSLSRQLLALAAAAAVTPWASAHPGHDGGHDFTWDFSGGLAHPLSGLDHVLALIAVGLWAAQLGGRARWLVPAAFVGLMSLGAVLGHCGLEWAGVEQGIAASVFVLGLLIARSVRLPVGAGMMLVGFFALFHGVAHGSAMPATTGAVSYGAGFLLAAVLLLSAGLGLGTLAARRSEKMAGYAGWGIAAAGLALFSL